MEIDLFFIIPLTFKKWGQQTWIVFQKDRYAPPLLSFKIRFKIGFTIIGKIAFDGCYVVFEQKIEFLNGLDGIWEMQMLICKGRINFIQNVRSRRICKMGEDNMWNFLLFEHMFTLGLRFVPSIGTPHRCICQWGSCWVSMFSFGYIHNVISPLLPLTKISSSPTSERINTGSTACSSELQRWYWHSIYKPLFSNSIWRVFLTRWYASSVGMNYWWLLTWKRKTNKGLHVRIICSRIWILGRLKQELFNKQNA